jgi:hypothetical protein
MTDKEKVIAVILKIREREEELNQKAKFCDEHNFRLEQDRFNALAQELRRVISLLKNEFEIGNVYSSLTRNNNDKES